MNMMEKPNIEPQDEGTGIFMEGGKIIVRNEKVGPIEDVKKIVDMYNEKVGPTEGGETITVPNEKVGPVEGGETITVPKGEVGPNWGINVQNEKVGPIEDVKKIVDMYNEKVGPIEGGEITVKMNKPETKAPTE